MFSEERFDLLIKTLKEIETDGNIEPNRYLNNNPNGLIVEAETLANEVLVNESFTGVDYPIIKKMSENGYEVFPGERDSFGWVTGCIKTKKGIIIFG
jgi:hypothetical protein